MSTVNTQNLTFKGSELLFFNSQKPVLHPARTIANPARKFELSARSNDSSKDSSRLRAARHIYGFRTYNRAHQLECDLRRAVASLKHMMKQPFNDLDHAIDGAETALTQLHAAETEFYAVVDRITKFESKVRELGFLKCNVERCITSSVASVKADLKRLSLCQTGSNMAPTPPLSGNSTMQTLDRIIKEPWRGHIQLRTQIDKLKLTVLSTPDLESIIPGLKSPDIQKIDILLVQVEEYLEEKHSVNKIKQIVTADIDEEVMIKMLGEINEYQEDLANTVILRQAIASTIARMSREATLTAQVLKRRTKTIQSRIDEEQKNRDIDAEENVLMEFIRNGQHFEKKYKQDTGDEKRPSDIVSGTKSLKRPFDVLSPNVSPGVQRNAGSPRPVWAQAWTTKTKILKKRENTDYNVMHNKFT